MSLKDKWSGKGGYHNQLFDPLDLYGNRTEQPYQVSNLTPAQQAMFDEMFKGLEGKDISDPTQAYKSSDEEKAYLEFLKNYSTKYGADYARSTAAEVSSSYNGDSTRKYFADVVKPAWEQNTKPALEEAYSGYSGWTTTRANAIQKSADELGRTEATALFEVDKKRQDSYANVLGQLLGQIPGQEAWSMGEAANLSHKMEGVEANPYYIAAQNLLGIKTFDTIVPNGGGMFQGLFK